MHIHDLNATCRIMYQGLPTSIVPNIYVYIYIYYGVITILFLVYVF